MNMGGIQISIDFQRVAAFTLNLNRNGSPSTYLSYSPHSLSRYLHHEHVNQPKQTMKMHHPSSASIGNFDGYIDSRDYVGALATIDFGQAELNPVDKLLWIGYCSSKPGQVNKL